MRLHNVVAGPEGEDTGHELAAAVGSDATAIAVRFVRGEDGPEAGELGEDLFFFFCSWSCRLFKASVERVREGFQGGVESDPRRGKKKEVILRLAFWFLLLFSLRRTKKIRRHRSTFAHFACLSFHSLALSLLRFLCPSRI